MFTKHLSENSSLCRKGEQKAGRGPCLWDLIDQLGNKIKYTKVASDGQMTEVFPKLSEILEGKVRK